MKRLLMITAVTGLLFIAASVAWYISALHATGKPVPYILKPDSDNKRLLEKLNTKNTMAKQFCETNHFNTRFCFLVDISIESGRNRFFVYDMQKNIIIKTGLVTHGCCNQTWLTGRRYGNTIGCNCTSPGKYKIGKPYLGKFGRAYKLYGLDTTNSNAYKRYIVLHSMQCVPEKEVYPYPICQSNGCPAVSPSFLKELSAVIDSGKAPVLLWIFDE